MQAILDGQAELSVTLNIQFTLEKQGIGILQVVGYQQESLDRTTDANIGRPARPDQFQSVVDKAEMPTLPGFENGQCQHPVFKQVQVTVADSVIQQRVQQLVGNKFLQRERHQRNPLQGDRFDLRRQRNGRGQWS